MLHYGCFNFDVLGRKCRAATKSELARANFVYLGQGQNVANLHVFEARDGEEVSRREKVFSACDSSYDIAVWLVANTCEGGGQRRGGGGRRGLGV